jgi:hypothetical protein
MIESYLALNTSGIPICQANSMASTIEKELVGGFLSAMHSFSSTVQGGSLSKIEFQTKKIYLLLKPSTIINVVISSNDMDDNKAEECLNHLSNELVNFLQTNHLDADGFRAQGIFDPFVKIVQQMISQCNAESQENSVSSGSSPIKFVGLYSWEEVKSNVSGSFVLNKSVLKIICQAKEISIMALLNKLKPIESALGLSITHTQVNIICDELINMGFIRKE